MKRPKMTDEPQPVPVWDWREAIIHLSAAELNELIRNAKSIVAEKQDELREEMLARFRREAHSLGLNFDDLLPKVAPRREKERPKAAMSDLEELAELPANAEARIIRVLKFNDGQAGQKLITTQVFNAVLAPKLIQDKAEVAWVKKQRRLALLALLNDMVARNVIVVLRPPRGVGTQTIYGLTAMQADAADAEAALVEEVAG